VVSLISFGTSPVRAELRPDDGTIIGRYGAREDDWNIAASRLLPAGRYRLQFRSAAAPEGAAVDAPSPPAYANLPSDDNGTAGDTDSDGAAPPATEDAQKAQTDATQGAVAPQPNTNADAGSGNADGDKPTVSLRLARPETLPEQAAPTTAGELPRQGVHVLNVAQPAAGTLLVAQATSPAALVLALERQGASGWETFAIGNGRSPVVASPADSDPRRWRIEVWTVDGGPEPIRFAARAIAIDAQASGTVSLPALDGMPRSLAVAHVKVAAPGPPPHRTVGAVAARDRDGCRGHHPARPAAARAQRHRTDRSGQRHRRARHGSPDLRPAG
jgi:hypothetical protein